ncbi:MAG: 6-phosphogluconolactonase [Acidimicrobiales bacterium]
MPPELTIVDDLAGAFSERVVAAFGARRHDVFCLALCGGSTATLCYRRLAEVGAASVDWLSVNIYWGDERCVPADDPDSNQLLGRRELLEKVGAANAVYPMSCDDGPDAYQLRIGEIGQLDLVHLGVGPDGHTASLFPDSAALHADPGQLVTLNEDPAGRNPHRRMTLTFAGIARARLAVVTVGGASKRDVMEALVAGADLPAAHIRADEVVWLVDGEAAPRNHRH